MMIAELPDDVKSYIRSGVAITSLTQCVEELLLNSIDAGATNVAVRVDVGCFKVQVVDNGHGIREEELPLIGNRYSTSKCHTVSDLDDLRYFGYRGEALASIKDACGILEIVTKTKTDSKPLCKLFQDGKPLPIKESAIPRPSVGTTITVHALFMNFPVRQKSINEGLELEKIRQRVAGLALMKPHVSVRLRNDSNGATIIHTSKCSSTLVTFASLFGQTKAQCLVEIKGTKGQFTVEGYYGKEGSTKKDIQFVYVNGRLVLKTKIHKVINQLLKKSAICKKKFDLSLVSPDLPNSGDGLQKSPGKQLDKHPMFVVNVKCPLTEYDITFDPAKTLVEFKDWETLLQNITEVSNDFLKKEKLNLNQTDPLNEENNEKAQQGEDKYVPEISPSNIKDVLISKAARRPGYRPNLPVKTPETIPFEKWKAQNADLADTSDIPSSSSICDNQSKSLDSSNEDFEKCCDKKTDSGNNKTLDKDNGRKDREGHDKFCDNKHVCDTTDYPRKGPLQSGPNEVLINDTHKHTNIGRPRSALSAFRKSIGKSTGEVLATTSTNIDEGLDRISKILPSTSQSIEKSLSSLQRFRKYVSKYSKTDVELDEEHETLPPKFGRLNDVPKLVPHEYQAYRSPSEVTDGRTSASTAKKTVHNMSQINGTKPSHPIPGKSKPTSSAENELISGPGTSNSCSSNYRSLSANAQHNSFFTNKLTSENAFCKNHNSDTNSDFEKQCGRPVLQVKEAPKPWLRDFDLDEGFWSRTGRGTSESISVKAVEHTRPCGSKQTDELDVNRRLSTHIPSITGERKRPSNYSEEIAPKVTKLQNRNTIEDDNSNYNTMFNDQTAIPNCSLDKSVKECFETTPFSDTVKWLGTMNSGRDNQQGMLSNKTNFDGMGDETSTVENAEHHQSSSDRNVAAFQRKLSNCSLNQAAVTRFSLKRDNVQLVDTACNTDACQVIPDSPNNIRGSQLFKNLPDAEIGGSQDSNNSEIFVAVPLDTNKVIQGIVTAGINLADKPTHEFSSQEFILGTESQEMTNASEAGSVVNDDHDIDLGSTLLDTTQKFTPMNIDECLLENESLVDDSQDAETTIKNTSDNNKVQSSPCSTGFTPRLEDAASPQMNESRSTIVQTPDHQNLDETIVTIKHPSSSHKDENTGLLVPQRVTKQGDLNEVENNRETDKCNDTQDTLEMPSILCTSRLDISDIGETVSPHTKESLQYTASSNPENRQTIGNTSSNMDSMRDTDELHDDITVTQLLNINSCISSSCDDSQRNKEEIITFRDIFTPTQSQTNTQNNSEKTQQIAANNVDHNVDKALASKNDDAGFSDTFDEELLNMNSQVFESTAGTKEWNTLDVSEGISEKYEAEHTVGGNYSHEKKDQEQTTDQTTTDVDTLSDKEGQWIEMKHPDTGKTVYIHSKLGTVVDKIVNILKTDEKDKDALKGQARSAKTTPRRNKGTPSSAKLDVTDVTMSSLQKMFHEHQEKKDIEADIKWRDKAGRQSAEASYLAEGSSITNLFSDWENPVFGNNKKSVLNAETSNISNITNRSTFKAMQTLHTCRFTKDMLNTVEVIGQLDKKFIVCLIQTDTSVSGPDMLALIDQHAAHERVRIELLTEEAYVDGNIDRAELAKFSVDPGKAIKMDPEEIQVMMSFRDEFSRIGITFRMDTHADDMIKVLTVPDCLVVKDSSDVPKKEMIYWDTIQTLIKGHVELLVTTQGAKGRLPSIIHKLLCSQACHGAIKFGDKLSMNDCKSLIHDLSLCDLPFQCAHGRPAVMPILQLQQLDSKLPKAKPQKPQLHKLHQAIDKQKQSIKPSTSGCS